MILEDIKYLKIKSINPLSELGGWGVRYKGTLTAYILDGSDVVEVHTNRQKIYLGIGKNSEKVASFLQKHFKDVTEKVLCLLFFLITPCILFCQNSNEKFAKVELVMIKDNSINYGIQKRVQGIGFPSFSFGKKIKSNSYFEFILPQIGITRAMLILI